VAHVVKALTSKLRPFEVIQRKTQHARWWAMLDILLI